MKMARATFSVRANATSCQSVSMEFGGRVTDFGKSSVYSTTTASVDVNVAAGGAVISVAQTANGGTLTWSGAAEVYEDDIRTDEWAGGGMATGLAGETLRTITAVSAVSALELHMVSVSLEEAP